MSLIKELAKENLLYIALAGVRGVLERELEIKSIQFAMTETYKQEMMRKASDQGKPISYPWSYFLIQSLAGSRDVGNNYAVRKHGLRFTQIGEKATSKKGYLFPIKLGLDFHYVDSDPKRLLTMAQALVLLSASGGLKFDIDVGDMLTFTVSLEIPIDQTITLQEEQNAQLPEATDINAQIVMSTTIGFFRDVSAVNGQYTSLRVTLKSNGQDEETFELEGPTYVQPW